MKIKVTGIRVEDYARSKLVGSKIIFRLNGGGFQGEIIANSNDLPRNIADAIDGSNMPKLSFELVMDSDGKAETSPEERFCKDCVHSSTMKGAGKWMPLIKEIYECDALGRKDPVTGKLVLKKCVDMRSEVFYEFPVCGPDGKLWKRTANLNSIGFQVIDLSHVDFPEMSNIENELALPMAVMERLNREVITHWRDTNMMLPSECEVLLSHEVFLRLAGRFTPRTNMTHIEWIKMSSIPGFYKIPLTFKVVNDPTQDFAA